MRMVVLWLVLLAVFVFAFKAGVEYELDSTEVLFATAIALFVPFFVGLTVTSVRWQRRNNRGISLLMAGELDDAARHFEPRWWVFVPAYRAIARYNLGLTRLTQGRVDEALTLFRTADGSRRLRGMVFLHHGVPGLIALGEALNGNLPVARQQLQEVERRRGALPVAMSIPAEMVVLCREGHPAAALKLFDARARQVDQLSGITRKVAFLCRAFAIAKDGGEVARVREALGGAWPLNPGQFDFLGRHWPEMRSFLAAQELLREAA